ncbi:hypothetical protein ACN4EK_30850 [Pantanalinema rosaneae CENA516]|uniref:hypothetical protein n=1 Tax=Pantanalinema rosaneae TaxID=1620701 RepID=UPI003D6DE636
MANVNANPRQATKPAAVAPMPTAAPQSPSVPISLYREVVTELQTAQGMLKTLQTDNQQLMQQNQQLRLEIERVVQSSLRLRQVADGYQHDGAIAPVDPTLTNLEAIFDLPPATIIQAPSRQKSAKSKTSLPAEISPSSEKRLTEQEPQLRQSAPPDKSSEISAWWLALVICTIIVTAFGTGFLIVRPLLPPR